MIQRDTNLSQEQRKVNLDNISHVVRFADNMVWDALISPPSCLHAQNVLNFSSPHKVMVLLGWVGLSSRTIIYVMRPTQPDGLNGRNTLLPRIQELEVTDSCMNCKGSYTLVFSDFPLFVRGP